MSPPGGSVYEFAGHETHRDLSLSESKPGAHGWHVSAVDALTASEYFPGSQSLHAIDPGVVLYLPATQATQLTFTPDQPALQTQDVMLSLSVSEYEFAGHERHSDLSLAEYKPAVHSLHVSLDALTASEYFPGSQSVHTADPVVVLYLPATHAVQLPFRPNQPALHTLDVMLALPAVESEFTHSKHFDMSFAEYEPAVHSLHVSLDALTASEYFPGSQSVHTADPVVVLYLPATHAVQLPFRPNQPALHTQDVMLALPAVESEFTHSKHFDMSFAEYEPLAHSLHVSLDALTTSEYFPTHSQCTQQTQWWSYICQPRMLNSCCFVPANQHCTHRT